jgi:CheY-like chemotaxis protein
MDLHKKILIIDPDVKIMKEYLLLFQDQDYEIETGRGVSEAVEKIKYIPFDCLIMDVRLPEMKGYEAIPIIKAVDSKIEIIMTAKENTIEQEASIRRQDIFYYYIKSFDREELKSAVNNVFKKLGKSKEVKKMNKKPLILIVDDDADFVEATKTILAGKNYQLQTASNKTEAFEKIKKIKPDLILLDIMMERLDDGFTICYKLKHDPQLKNIPVLAISSITEKTGFRFSPKTDGEYFEANDYVEKPIEPDDLLRRVEFLLNR